jgi:outer membrane protein assembly factor BamB
VDGTVSRIALADGAVRWRARLTGAIRAAPVPAPGAVLVATAADTLYRLADSTGAVIRRRPTPGAVLAAPALADSTLIIGTSTGRIEALDPVTLRLRWTLDLGAPVVGSVAVFRGTVYTVSARGRLVAVPLAGPAEAARSTEVGLVMRAGPMPVPGGLFVCGVNGEVVRFDAELVRRWSTRVEAPLSEPVLVDGRSLLVVSQRGDVVLYR